MPRGQKPQGEHALSNAERQARYRARHLQPPPHVVIRTRRPVDRRSRIQRWDDATNALLGIQAECVSWLAGRLRGADCHPRKKSTILLTAP
jgi:hypothetical protein